MQDMHIKSQQKKSSHLAKECIFHALIGSVMITTLMILLIGHDDIQSEQKWTCGAELQTQKGWMDWLLNWV